MDGFDVLIGIWRLLGCALWLLLGPLLLVVCLVRLVSDWFCGNDNNPKE